MTSSPDLRSRIVEQLIEKLERDICRLGPSCDNGNYTVSYLTLTEATGLLAALRDLPASEGQKNEELDTRVDGRS